MRTRMCRMSDSRRVRMKTVLGAGERSTLGMQNEESLATPGGRREVIGIGNGKTIV
jgi:hypothetical protein